MAWQGLVGLVDGMLVSVKKGDKWKKRRQEVQRSFQPVKAPETASWNTKGTQDRRHSDYR